MNVSPDFVLWGKIKREFEGCELVAYKDTGGVWTIGFGTTYLFDKQRKVKQGDAITFEDAVKYMQHDAEEVVKQANQYVKKVLTDYQSTAICDYIYNRGIGNFLKTQLDELINANPGDKRIGEEIRATGLKDRLGNLLNGLVRRRKCEAYLYETGQLRFKF